MDHGSTERVHTHLLFCESRIDDVDNAIDSERRLGNISRKDDLPAVWSTGAARWGWRVEDLALAVHRQGRVQGEDQHVRHLRDKEGRLASIQAPRSRCVAAAGALPASVPRVTVGRPQKLTEQPPLLLPPPGSASHLVCRRHLLAEVIDLLLGLSARVLNLLLTGQED